MDYDNNEERREEKKEPQVYTYDPEEIYGRKGPKKGGRGPGGWKKGLIIFLIIAVVVVLAGVGCNAGASRFVRETLGGTSSEDYDFSSEYIGVLEVHGTMSSESDSSSSYNQAWLLARVEQMKNDPLNQGLILSINTPGGEVYAVDELYLKVKEYEQETGRPVYAYMESMAASGGYYLSAGTERIYANRNCWTGSIGVTIGSVYDISGFLEKMGVKTVTITSGANKSMGSMTEPLTKEQRDIYQSLVDEAYEQFIGIVAEGRGMSAEKAKKLGDGRVYTAKQAKKNGLIDEIGTLEDAVDDMKRAYELRCGTQTISYQPSTSIWSLLSGAAKDNDVKSQYDQLMDLMEKNGTFTVTYLSEVRK